MGITGMNHAVLYVRDARRQQRFYTDVLGFRSIIDDPDGQYVFMRGPGLGQPPRHRLLHDRRRGRAERGRRAHGRHVPHRLGGAARSTSSTRCATRLAAAGALVGASDHGANKSLYAKDPDGLEFEVMWLTPAEHWGDEEHEAVIRPLDLEAAKRKYAGRDGAIVTVEFGPVTRQTVAEQVRARLAERIASGELAPGSPVPAERSAERTVRRRPHLGARSDPGPGVARRGRAPRQPHVRRRAPAGGRLRTPADFAADSRKLFVVQLFETRRVLELPIFELASCRATAEEREAIAAAAPGVLDRHAARRVPRARPPVPLADRQRLRQPAAGRDVRQGARRAVPQRRVRVAAVPRGQPRPRSTSSSPARSPSTTRSPRRSSTARRSTSSPPRSHHLASVEQRMVEDLI